MLIARFKDQLIEASDMLPHSSELSEGEHYFCHNPNCPTKILVLRKGKIKQPHFAHKNKNELCEKYSEPETQAHLAMKRFVKNLLDIPNDLIEVYGYNGVRPDLIWKRPTDNQIYAIEVQHSRISQEEYHRRNQAYNRHKLIPIWIFHVKETPEISFFEEGIFTENLFHNKIHAVSPMETPYNFFLKIKESSIENTPEFDFFLTFQYTSDFYSIPIPNRIIFDAIIFTIDNFIKKKLEITTTDIPSCKTCKFLNDHRCSQIDLKFNSKPNKSVNSYRVRFEDYLSFYKIHLVSYKEEDCFYGKCGHRRVVIIPRFLELPFDIQKSLILCLEDFELGESRSHFRFEDILHNSIAFANCDLYCPRDFSRDEIPFVQPKIPEKKCVWCGKIKGLTEELTYIDHLPELKGWNAFNITDLIHQKAYFCRQCLSKLQEGKRLCQFCKKNYHINQYDSCYDCSFRYKAKIQKNFENSDLHF